MYFNVSSTNYTVQYQRFRRTDVTISPKSLIIYVSPLLKKGINLDRFSSFAPQEYPNKFGIPFGLSSVSLPPVAVPSGCPRMSFCETIDEQSAIVPAQIAEVRIWKNFSLTGIHPNPLHPLLGGSRFLRSRSLRGAPERLSAKDLSYLMQPL